MLYKFYFNFLKRDLRGISTTYQCMKVVWVLIQIKQLLEKGQEQSEISEH